MHRSTRCTAFQAFDTVNMTILDFLSKLAKHASKISRTHVSLMVPLVVFCHSANVCRRATANSHAKTPNVHPDRIQSESDDVLWVLTVSNNYSFLERGGWHVLTHGGSSVGDAMD